jgi:hypothetical protein
VAGDGDVFDDDLGLDELFESEGEAGESGEPGSAATRKRLCKLDRVSGGGGSETLELLADGARVTLVEGEEGDQLLLDATLVNHLERPLELDELVLVLRDGAGALLDVVDRWVNTKFARSQEIIGEFDCGPGVAAEVATVEVVAEIDFAFQGLMALGHVEDVPFLGEVPHRRVVAVDTRVAPAQRGWPSWDIQLAAFVGYSWEAEVEVILDLREHGECADGSREIIVALRDAEGGLIAKEALALDKVGATCRTRAKVHFTLPPHELPGLSRIDVAVAGSCVRRECLGTFEIVRMH